jgi:ABC-type branched-subunit amino acid transport system substrate-binding protein
MLRTAPHRLIQTVLLLVILLTGVSLALAAEDEQLSEGMRLYQIGDESAAWPLLNDGIAATNDSSAWPEARLAAAIIALHRGEYAAALSRISGIAPELRTDQMRLVEGEALLALAMPTDAAATLRRIDEQNLSAAERLRRLDALFAVDTLRGERLSALWFAHRALQLASDDAATTRRLYQRIVDLLAEPTATGQLPEITFMFTGTPISTAARLQQVRHLLAAGEENRARTLMLQVDIGLLPAEARGQASELYSQLLGISWLQRSVGVLLPLSGKFAPYGELVRRGIDLALENRADRNPRVHVIYADSAADAETSRQAMRNLARGDKVIAVTGAITGSAAEAAAVQAQEELVPLLTLSQRDGLPAIGPYVFRDALTPQLQGRAIAYQAVMELGLAKIAILYPENRLGNALADAFAAEVNRLGGEISGRQPYDPQATDFGLQIKRLKGENPYHNLENLSTKEQLADLFVPDEPLPFEALFLPDFADRVGLIAPQLAYYGIEQTQLLGTGGWHSPELLRLAGDFVEGGLFVDGYYGASSDPAVQQFVNRYRERYNEDPTILEAQGYDAAGLLLTVLENPAIRTRDDMRQALLSLPSYTGVTGTTRFTEEGEADRTLYLLQVRKGQFVPFEVDRAADDTPPEPIQ